MPAAPPRRLPGATHAGWSPRPAFAGLPTQVDRVLERELARLEAVLGDGRPRSRAELAREAPTRGWGPGRLGRALGIGVAEGRILRVARDRYRLAGRLEPRDPPPADGRVRPAPGARVDGPRG